MSATATLIIAEITNALLMLLTLQAKLQSGQDITDADLAAARQRTQDMLARIDAAVAAQETKP